jgi:biopolymer transport protein TolR
MTASFSRRLRTRKLKSEINVVPYIDVMLVLLIIFMITAPLLNLGVDIDLPDSEARGISTQQDPVIVSVDSTGGYTLKLADAQRKPVSAAQLDLEMRSLVATNPDIAVFVAGDKATSYDVVYQAMVLLQAAGVDKISLMSKPPEAR